MTISLNSACMTLKTSVVGGAMMEKEGPMIDMSALESHQVKSRLSTVGLGPICDWVMYGCQADDKITGSLICAFAKMLTEYLPDIPTDETQLEGTPYSKTVRMNDNMDSNGCVEYKETLEPAFRNTAQFGDQGYGKHCWSRSHIRWPWKQYSHAHPDSVPSCIRYCPWTVRHVILCIFPQDSYCQLKCVQSMPTVVHV